VPALEFARDTLLNPHSPACVWKHPVMAGKVVVGALENLLLPFGERTARGAFRECPVCAWEGHRFRNFLSADEIISRGLAPKVMVGFSLSTALRFLLEHEGLARCFRTDSDADDRRFSPDLVADLRQSPLRDASVDWVFCSHVLEHIPELEICIDEIMRILRPGGSAWLQVPFEAGRAHSRRIAIDPNRAHAHAWQFAPDFGNLIERTGWTVTETVAADAYPAGELQRYGIDPAERFWQARKEG